MQAVLTQMAIPSLSIPSRTIRKGLSLLMEQFRSMGRTSLTFFPEMISAQLG